MSRPTGVRRELSDEAMKALMVYDWPGNVRELENCIERACTMSTGPVLHPLDLSSPVQNAIYHTPLAGGAISKVMPLAQMEKQAILSAINQLGGDKLLAARLLGIGKTTLYRKLKEYGCRS
jgi:two-component system response regulator HydG